MRNKMSKPLETRVEHSIANICVVKEGRCHVPAFNLTRPEGCVLYDIHRMSEAKKLPDGPEKDKKEADIMTDFQMELSNILNLDNRDCEALTAYALTKGQEGMLIPLYERMGDGVANMRFDLPAVDLTQKDALAADLKQFGNEASSNNTLLQVLAFHKKLDFLPHLKISQKAIDEMKQVQPTKRTAEKSQPIYIKRVGKGHSY